MKEFKGPRICDPASLNFMRPSVEAFAGKLSRTAQKTLQASSVGMYSKQRLPDGRVRVTGGKRLKASGQYTAAFGKHVANLLLKNKLRVLQLHYKLCIACVLLNVNVSCIHSTRAPPKRHVHKNKCICQDPS